MSISPAVSRVAGSAFLTDAQLTALRGELEVCRRHRREQEAVLEERIVADDDPVARAHVVHVREVLGSVEAALGRLADGSYGTCVHCSAPIPYERLELMPYTEGCVTCLRRLTPWR